MPVSTGIPRSTIQAVHSSLLIQDQAAVTCVYWFLIWHVTLHKKDESAQLKQCCSQVNMDVVTMDVSQTARLVMMSDSIAAGS